MPVLNINWLNLPEEQDYPAAMSYLNLIHDNQTSENLTQQLKNAKMTTFKAKDIFRASNLSLLGISNSHVEKNISKVKGNKPLSPILLVRDQTNGKVVIADGYHRLCAVYFLNEDALIPCKIV